MGSAALLQRTSTGEPGGGSPPPSLLARLYDAITYNADPLVRDWALGRFDVVSVPEEPLTVSLQRGDILLRRAEGDFAHACVIADPVLRSSTAISRAGGAVELPAPGQFVFIVERGLRPHVEEDRFARQVTGPDGRLLRHQLLLRPRLTEGESEGLSATSLLLGMTLAGTAGASKPPPQTEAAFLTRTVSEDTSQGPTVTASGSPVSRSRALTQANALLAEFRHNPNPGRWHANLTRPMIADRLEQLIQNPSLVDQVANGLCGEAAFFNVWLWEDPLAVTRFAVQLYNSGAAAVGVDEWVRPRPSLLSQDIQKVIRMALAKRHTPPANWGGEWMLMSALRDANNWVFSYDGTPCDEWGSGSTNGEVVRWLKATRLFRSVSFDKGDPLKINPTNAIVLVACDSHMLGNTTTSSTPDDDHFFVLRSGVIESQQACCSSAGASSATSANCVQDVVDFRYWSWAEDIQWVNDRRCNPGNFDGPPPGPLPKAQFLREYFGHITARR